MKTGFNLLLWTTDVTEEHFPIIEKLAKTGYDGVEIPIFGGDVAQYEKLGKVIKDNGLGCTSVTVIPDHEHSAISSDAKARAGAVELLKERLECSAACGSEVLVGPFYHPLGEFTGDGPTDDEINHGADTHRKVAEIAESVGVHLGIEPLNRFECYFLNTIEQAAAYARKVGHPFFGTMYDTFHANIEEKDPAGVIGANLDVIKHVHISENDRGTPGEGHVDFDPVFAALKAGGYDGWVTVEAFGRALPDLAAATRVWRDFFPSREHCYENAIKLLKRYV